MIEHVEPAKLREIFEFLKENRKYPLQVHTGAYKQCLNPDYSTQFKAKSLLHHYLNTQSRLNLNKSLKFWTYLERNKSCLNTFDSFSKQVCKGIDAPPYERLYLGLKAQEGWGSKTSALFVKAIYHIHYGKLKVGKLWTDVPAFDYKVDKMMVPVDEVIKHIFMKLLRTRKMPSFARVNNEIKALGIVKNVDIWDDLWFWGFITQITKNKKRTLTEWNAGKFYSLLHSPKDENTVNDVREKARQFHHLILDR
ncbi:MAG: hypothetical protein H6568_07015 [Lewinellaceae bacterium]|nr:hypothetical protein [Lewinellaceae bacterium]